jgi:phage terminase small subunit
VNKTELRVELQDVYGLTEQQALWAIAYVTTARFSGPEAARQAGYADPTTVSSRLKANPNAMAACKFVASMENDGFTVTRERVVAELSAVAFSKITDVVDIEGTEVVLQTPKLKDLPEMTQRAINAVKVTTQEMKDGRLKTEVKVVMHDKIEALKLLALMTGGALPAQMSQDDWTGLTLLPPRDEAPEPDGGSYGGISPGNEVMPVE